MTNRKCDRTKGVFMFEKEWVPRNEKEKEDRSYKKRSGQRLSKKEE